MICVVRPAGRNSASFVVVLRSRTVPRAGAKGPRAAPGSPPSSTAPGAGGDATGLGPGPAGFAPRRRGADRQLHVVRPPDPPRLEERCGGASPRPGAVLALRGDAPVPAGQHGARLEAAEPHAARLA